MQYNTPTIIYYHNKEFKINTRKFYEQYESIWKCVNLRREKDKPKNQKYYCNAGIKGIRETNNCDTYKFYLLESHSEICNNLDNKMQKEKINKVQNDQEYKNIEIKKENKETSNKNEAKKILKMKKKIIKSFLYWIII